MSDLEQSQQFVRVVHPDDFSFHDRFLREIKAGLGGDRLLVDGLRFGDGSDYLRVITESKTFKQAIVPLWIRPPLSESIFEMLMIGNALTHQERGRPPVADRVTALVIYEESRMDKDSSPATGEYQTGEAITAEIFAQCLGLAYDEAIILGCHSSEAASYLNIPILHVTAAPLFADWLIENGKINPKTKIVALDKGSLQGCLRLCDRVGLDRKSNVVVCDKHRGGHNIVSGQDILYGDFSGDNLIIFDDRIDTAGSIGATCAAINLSKGGVPCVEGGGLTVMATHGILSLQARANIQHLLEGGTISDLVLTDSLPAAAYKLEGIEGVVVLPAAPLMSRLANEVIERSIADIEQDPGSELAPYIMRPQPKEEVWAAFQTL